MDRTRLETLLAAYLDGTLSVDEAEEWEAILRESPSSRARMADAAELHRLLGQELRGEEARADGVKAIMRAVVRAAHSRMQKETTTEVMSKVRRRRRQARAVSKRHTWVRYGLVPLGAAATALVAAVAAWLLLGSGYPQPSVTGEVDVIQGNEIARGAVLEARREAALRLGGYAEVAMRSDTILRIEGRDRAEQVYLRAGTIVCTVDRDLGKRSFSVRTDVGTVSVGGTRFVVAILELEGGAEMKAKRILVEVLLGTVLVSGSWGKTTLAAGESEVLPRPEQATSEGQQAATAPRGRIEAGRPTYLAKGHEAWRDRGRIVGVARNAPEFEVNVLGSTGKIFSAPVGELGNGRSACELWLRPGVYVLRVAAEGYERLELKGLEVRAGSDLRIDLEFTPRE